MSLLDDLSLPATPEELERRKFLGLLGAGALGVAGLGTVITAIRYFEPDVFYELASRFAVGRPEDIPLGMVVVLPRQKVYVVHAQAGFVALSAVCTHLGCMTRWEGEKITCPCHGSEFSLGGQVTGGPAPRPLPRVALAVERGQLVVDPSRRAPDDFVLVTS